MNMLAYVEEKSPVEAGLVSLRELRKLLAEE